VTHRFCPSGPSRPLRSLWRFLTTPVVACAVHPRDDRVARPRPFDLAARDSAVHVWLINGVRSSRRACCSGCSFIAPRRPSGRECRWPAGPGRCWPTTVVMIFHPISRSIFGEPLALPPVLPRARRTGCRRFAAINRLAILWVCGELLGRAHHDRHDPEALKRRDLPHRDTHSKPFGSPASGSRSGVVPTHGRHAPR